MWRPIFGGFLSWLHQQAVYQFRETLHFTGELLSKRLGVAESGRGEVGNKLHSAKVFGVEGFA